MSRSLYLFLLLLCFHVMPLHSREPYSAKITVDHESVKESATNVLGLSQELHSSSIQKLIPIYTPTSAVSFLLNLRGITADASFAANSTTLVFTIPQLDITQTFTGVTRDDSVTLFKDYITSTVQQQNKHFLQAHARLTPIDPIAGNPNSLQAQMAQSDFMMGRLTPFSGCSDCWEAQPVTHLFQGDFNFSRVFAGGFDSAAYSLPHRYSYSPKGTWALVVDVPLSIIYVGGAYAITGSAGLGFRFPITHSWSLTPTLRFGSGGSVDLNCGGNFIAPGLTSAFNWRLSPYLVLSLMDSVGYYSSTNFWLGGINLNYRLHNTVFKNGLFLTTCKGFCLCGRELNGSVWAIDSYFAGNKLFIRHYGEVGISLLTTRLLPWLEYDCLSLGAAYQFGNHRFHGYTLNLAYQF